LGPSGTPAIPTLFLASFEDNRSSKQQRNEKGLLYRLYSDRSVAGSGELRSDRLGLVTRLGVAGVMIFILSALLMSAELAQG
jgi:hypothetical protein